MPFNPKQSTATQVGTASFKPSAADTGVLTYNVSGVAVNKNIQRQTLTPVPLAGSYAGGVTVNDSGCTDPTQNGPASLPVNISVTQSASGQLQFVFDLIGIDTCTLTSTGAVTQNGALYSFPGTTGCGTDAPYAVTVLEVRATSLGIEGRWTAPDAGGACHEEGRFSGVATF